VEETEEDSMKIKPVIEIMIIITIISISVFGGFKILCRCTDISQDLEYAKTVVADKAAEDLGEDFIVVTGKYDASNKFYIIGCINAEGNHAIQYIVTPSINKKEWFVREISSRTGGSAEDLFSVPLIIH